MSDDVMILGRVGRLEASVASLSNEFAGVKVELQTQGRDLSSINSAISNLADKLDRSRPSIAAIWAPLGAMTAMLSLIGGAIAIPQLQRIDRIQAAREQDEDQLDALRIEMAVTRERSDADLARDRARQIRGLIE